MATYADPVQDAANDNTHDREVAASPRIVVIEDEPLIRMDMVEMLADSGFVVVGSTGNAHDGVAVVRDTNPDVVLVDITMPKRAGEESDPSAGIDVVRALAGDHSAAIIMVTAHAQAHIAAEAAEAGAMGYLVKPVSAGELMATITVAVNQRRALQEAKDHAADLQSRVQARETVAAAVAVLRESLGWEEDRAYGWLRAAAMDQRVTLTEAALAILAKPPEGL